ncbi:MAG: phospho-N-acetylmuramoyl-pentapeptide-transferase [Chlamydiae bacterium]|nr:phospho-N-acetylmuramoyl-pentapeptide-transferase [Chlamydiota bacterium]
MLLLLIEFLSFHGLKVPAAFYFSSTRMILAALTSLLFTVLLGPSFIKKLYELKIGQSIRTEDCPVLAQLHQKKKDTPTMGGILILSAMICSMICWMDLHSSFTLILFITTCWLGFIGGYDDYLKLKYKNPKGLSGKKKLLSQILLSTCLAGYLLWPSATEAFHHGKWLQPPIAKDSIHKVAKDRLGSEFTACTLSTQQYVSQFYIPFYKDPIVIGGGMGLVCIFLFILFVVTGASNAVNLTDGLDGLASGCAIMVSVVLALFAFVSNNMELSRYLNILYIEGSGEIAIYLLSLTGACMGFLWYNGYPAQVFMGDTGSLSLGGILGVSAILLRREILFALVGGVFVMEALSVILQVASYKLRNKKRIFLCAPLHHHFEYKGWPETKVVLRFWIVTLLLAMLGVASLKFQ